MHDEYLEPSALSEYDVEARFAERLAALETYREVRERQRRGEARPGDRDRLRAARAVLNRTGGLPARWNERGL